VFDLIVTPEDRKIFQREFDDFLPKRIFDFHVHLWTKDVMPSSFRSDLPSLPVVVDEFRCEKLLAFYREALPGRELSFLLFGMPYPGVDLQKNNRYVETMVDDQRFFALTLVGPATPLEDLKPFFDHPGFIGYKPYWTFVVHKEQNDVSIMDMLSEEQLDFAHRQGLCVVLHIPRKLRLADPLNVEQIHWLASHYPNIKVVLAHLGRSYCLWSIEKSLEKLSTLPNLFWDITVVQNWEVLEFVFSRIAPERIIFGSDLPISAVRGKTVCVNEQNLFVTQESYPWSFSNPHLGYSFAPMLYESLRAVKKASQRAGWSLKEVEKIFYGNAYRLVQEIRRDKVKVKLKEGG